MYYGKKDWRPQIEIPVELCYEQKMSGETWVEVRIPDKQYAEAVNIKIGNTDRHYVNWKSFMVKPEQIFHKTNTTNVIEGLTQESNINICCHLSDDNGPYVMDRMTIETVNVFEIIRRIHAFYI